MENNNNYTKPNNFQPRKESVDARYRNQAGLVKPAPMYQNQKVDPNKQIKPLPPKQPQKPRKLSKKERRHTDFPGNPVKGRKFFKWTKFMFTMFVISLALVIGTFGIGIFMVLMGVISAFFWIIAIIIVSIFTLFIIWTQQDAKDFFNGWRDMNEKLLDKSNDVLAFAEKLVTPILIVGFSFFALAWLFIIIGLSTDKERKKKYLGHLIAMSILSAIFLLFAFLNIVAKTK